jgi:hypothetical protein
MITEYASNAGFTARKAKKESLAQALYVSSVMSESREVKGCLGCQFNVSGQQTKRFQEHSFRLAIPLCRWPPAPLATHQCAPAW